jgi:hypothetical protein
MKCDIFVLAEGATNDARGALALVGVNQRAISVDSLPFRITQKVVIGFTDESQESPGTFSDETPSGDLSINVQDPAGNSQFSVNQSFKIPRVPKPRPDVPQFSYIVADVFISGASHGIYTAEVTYRCVSGEVESRKFALYILPFPASVSNSAVSQEVRALS